MGEWGEKSPAWSSQDLGSTATNMYKFSAKIRVEFKLENNLATTYYADCHTTTWTSQPSRWIKIYIQYQYTAAIGLRSYTNLWVCASERLLQIGKYWMKICGLLFTDHHDTLYNNTNRPTWKFQLLNKHIFIVVNQLYLYKRWLRVTHKLKVYTTMPLVHGGAESLHNKLEDNNGSS